MVQLVVSFEIIILAEIECCTIFEVRSAFRLLFDVNIDVWCPILLHSDLYLWKIFVQRALGHFSAHSVIDFVSFTNLYCGEAFLCHWAS